MESFRDATIEARGDPRPESQAAPSSSRAVSPPLDPLLDLLSEFGRTKLSLSALVVRPVWREKVQAQLRQIGIEQGGPYTEEQFFQWLPIFYRLSRQLQCSPAGLSMRTVAEAMGVPVSTATRFIEGLVRRGVLQRHQDAQDRRLVLVRFTPQGQRVFEVIDTAVREVLAEMLGKLSPEEGQQLLQLGQRLLDLWRDSLEPVPSASPAAASPPKAASSQPGKHPDQ